MTGDEPTGFPGWDQLVPRIVNDKKVTIIEALWRIGEPLSMADVARVVIGEIKSPALVAYHVKTLVGAKVLVETDKRQRGGKSEPLYYFFSPSSYE